MAVISTFKAVPFDAFQDAPGGRNDPFVLSNDDPSILLSVSVDDDDATLDGDNIVNETPDDANQIATVTDADGNYALLVPALIFKLQRYRRGLMHDTGFRSA